MAEKILVLQGGKLIDGTGRPPIENSVIVIEGAGSKRSAEAAKSRFPPAPRSSMSRARPSCRASSTVTAISRISTASSTCISASPPASPSRSYQDGPWTLAQKAGHPARQNPRPADLDVRPRDRRQPAPRPTRPASRTSRGNIIVTTPEEARKAVQRKKELGYDIIKLNEFLPFDLVKVVVDEAHRLGCR